MFSPLFSSKREELLLLGRVLLSLVFLFSAYTKLSDMPDAVAYIQTAGLPAETILVWAAALIELAGGLMLVLGFHAKAAALGLAVYLLIVSYFFHLNVSDGTQTFHLLKNLGLMGGLVNLLASGSGRYSLKNCDCCTE